MFIFSYLKNKLKLWHSQYLLISSKHWPKIVITGKLEEQWWQLKIQLSCTKMPTFDLSGGRSCHNGPPDILMRYISHAVSLALIYGNLVFFACQIIEFLLDLREIKQKFYKSFWRWLQQNTHTLLCQSYLIMPQITYLSSTTIQIISVILKKTESNC